MQKTSTPAHLQVVLHITSCRRFAHATVGNLQIAFENPDAAGYPQKLAPNAFVATAARAQATGDDVAIGEISAAVQASCAAALNKELAELIEIAKPRKLTFAQVQKIYGRSVD